MYFYRRELLFEIDLFDAGALYQLRELLKQIKFRRRPHIREIYL